MKVVWLVANVTAVGSPDRAECDIVGVILGNFWPVQATFVVREPLCDVEMSPNNFTQDHLMKIE